MLALAAIKRTSPWARLLSGSARIITWFHTPALETFHRALVRDSSWPAGSRHCMSLTPAL